MPDPELSVDIVVILDKPCWERSIAEWEALIEPAIFETLRQSLWAQPAEINILLTDDAKIQELNKEYRGIDKPTNVLSFPSFEPEEIFSLKVENDSSEPMVLGDIALAYETIQKESLSQNKPFDHHLIHLAIHGVLHLLGFDHEKDEDATVMESLEVKILSSLKISNPYQE
jgi:probable rRNA maturation factor